MAPIRFNQVLARSTLPAFAVALAAGLVSCGGDVTTPPPVVPASVVVTPGVDTLLTLGRTRQFTGQALDADDNPVSTTLSWSSTDPAVATVSESGLVTAVGNGTTAIRATAGTIHGEAELVISQVVARVDVTPNSVGLTSLAHTQHFTAAAKDSSGAAVPGVRFLWVSSNPAVMAIDTSGVATPLGPGETTISATGRGVPGYAVAQVAQYSASLRILFQPTTTEAGLAIDPAIQVQVLDSDGVLMQGDAGHVTLFIATNPGGGTLSGTRTVQAINGTATFTGLSIDKAATGYQLGAVHGVSDSGVSELFNITPGPLARDTFLTQPPAVIEGNTPLPPIVVRGTDRFGNLVSGVTLSVGFATTPWPNSTLAGIVNRSLAAGQVTFDGLVVTKPGTYALAARDASGNAMATSASFRVATTLTQVSTGGQHSCAIGPNGTWCWGGDQFGQLGDGHPGSFADSVPALVLGAPVLAQVSAGGNHSCGVTAAREAWCWGADASGELGDGVPVSGGLVVKVAGSGAGALQFTQLSAGAAHTCAITTTSAVYCWGSNTSGQLGDGSTTQRDAPTLVPGTGAGGLLFTAISAGDNHSCGVTTTGEGYCWGSNSGGALGDGTGTDHPSPTLVSGSGTGSLIFTGIAAGFRHSCAVTTLMTAYCWGDDSQAQLGDVPGGPQLTPHLVPGSGSSPELFIAITAGGNHTCADAQGGFSYCWGENANGQIGNGTQVTTNGPAFVASFGSKLSAGSFSTCRVENAGGVTCWGRNASGQVGIGTTAVQVVTLPIRVIQ